MGPLLLLGLGAAGVTAVVLATKDDDDGSTSPTGGGAPKWTSSLPPRPPGVSPAQWEAIHAARLPGKKEKPEGMSDAQWTEYQANQFAGDYGYGSDIYGGFGVGDWFKDRWSDTKTGWKYMETVYKEDGAAAVASESLSAGGYAAQQAVAKGAAFATGEANAKLDAALEAVERMAAARTEWEATVNKLGSLDAARERVRLTPKIANMTSGFMDNQVRRGLEAARSLGGSWRDRADKISADLQRAQFSGVYGIVPTYGAVVAIPVSTAAVIIAGAVTVLGIAAALTYAYAENTSRIRIEKGLDEPTDWHESLAKAAPWIGGAVIVTGLLYKGLPALQEWKGQGNYGDYDYDDGPRTDYIDW